MLELFRKFIPWYGERSFVETEAVKETAPVIPQPKSQLELLVEKPSFIESPAVQVQVHYFMDFFHFDIHFVKPSATLPLQYHSEKKEKGEEIPEYRGLRVPHLSFSFDTHFDRTPALWLDHSQVYGGVGFGGGTFQRSKVTCYYHRYDHGINVSGKDEYPVLWAANDIWTVANFDQPVIKEVVDGLATNRLRLSGWDKEESAFNIHKRDKAPLARFMSEQLKHYFG